MKHDVISLDFILFYFISFFFFKWHQYLSDITVKTNSHNQKSETNTYASATHNKLPTNGFKRRTVGSLFCFFAKCTIKIIVANFV